jgi:hypothetical protein
VGPVNLVQFQAVTSLHIAAKYLVRGCPGEWGEEDDDTIWLVNALIPVYKRLPDSLEVLHIMVPEDQGEFELVVESVGDIILARKVQSYLSHLREIRLEAPFEGDGSAFGVLAVQHEANNAGIRLRKLDVSTHYGQSWIRGIRKPDSERQSAHNHVGNIGLDGDLEWEGRVSGYQLHELDG